MNGNIESSKTAAKPSLFTKRLIALLMAAIALYIIFGVAPAFRIAEDGILGFDIIFLFIFPIPACLFAAYCLLAAYRTWTSISPKSYSKFP